MARRGQGRRRPPDGALRYSGAARQREEKSVPRWRRVQGVPAPSSEVDRLSTHARAGVADVHIAAYDPTVGFTRAVVEEVAATFRPAASPRDIARRAHLLPRVDERRARPMIRRAARNAGTARPDTSKARFTTSSTSSAIPAESSRARRVLEENGLLVVVIGALGAALLLLGPALLVSDSWLALVAGREIAAHGLPSHDGIAVLTHGTRWTDQQWLAQLILYAEWALGGLRLAVIVNVGLVALTFASAVVAARLRGASARSVLYVTVPCLFVAPWSWQVRPQTVVLPLFVWTVYLLTRDVRRPSRITFVVFPVLVVWANLHGSVVFGATLTTLAGLAGIVRDRRFSLRAFTFVALPWACVLASPYALQLPAYYKLMLVDAPLARYVVEWQPAYPALLTAMFYMVAIATVIVVVARRRRFNGYELSILSLTLVEAVLAVRGIVWFALVAQLLVPFALDGIVRTRQPRSQRHRLDRLLAFTTVVALLAALIAVARRPQAWFEREWPGQAAATVAQQPRSTRVFASDRLADWLLWRVPSLRGRIAYDVRFELLDRGQLDPLLDFADQRGPDWARIAADYGTVVLDLRRHPARLASLRSEPATAVVYEKANEVAVVRRAEAGRVTTTTADAR